MGRQIDDVNAWIERDRREHFPLYTSQDEYVTCTTCGGWPCECTTRVDPPGTVTFTAEEVAALLDFRDNVGASRYPVPGVYRAFINASVKLLRAEKELSN